MRIPKHEGTTAQLGATYPFVANAPLPITRVAIGRDGDGMTYSYDPFELYQTGVLTNPNMLILGQVGRGKSALVKTYLYRQFAFGRRIVVIDPKGEYGSLSEVIGGEVLRVSAGGGMSFNPLAALDIDRSRARSDALAFSVVEGICAAILGRRLDVREAVALQVAIRSLLGAHQRLTLRAVSDQLFFPFPHDLSEFGSSSDALIEAGKMPGFAIRRLLGGPFGAVFDDASRERSADLSANALIIDVSEFYRSDALSVLMISLFGALQQSVLASPTPTILVLDEAWAVLANPIAAEFLQSFFKLSRSLGVSNVLVAHRPTDLVGDSVGTAIRDAPGLGSPSGGGLLSDCETCVLYALNHREADLAQRLFGLNGRHRELLVGLGRNTALWRVGRRTDVVRHHLCREEMPIVDTDARMRL